MKESIYQFEITDLYGNKFNMASLEGKKIMVVNTASKDGLIILSNVSPEHPNMGNVDDLCFLLMETLSKGE